MQQLLRRNLAAAGETIKCATSLNIKITADYVQQYLDTKQEALKENENSYMFKLKKLFKGE